MQELDLRPLQELALIHTVLNSLTVGTFLKRLQEIIFISIEFNLYSLFAKQNRKVT